MRKERQKLRADSEKLVEEVGGEGAVVLGGSGYEGDVAGDGDDGGGARTAERILDLMPISRLRERTGDDTFEAMEECQETKKLGVWEMPKRVRVTRSGTSLKTAPKKIKSNAHLQAAGVDSVD